MRVAFGTDERTPVTEHVKAHLTAAGHEVLALGEGDPWPDVGRAVGRAVADGQADRGVVCCWTGTGVSIAANKVAGVRSALCTDAETARGARRWNDANVLALGLASPRRRWPASCSTPSSTRTWPPTPAKPTTWPSSAEPSPAHRTRPGCRGGRGP